VRSERQTLLRLAALDFLVLASPSHLSLFAFGVRLNSFLVESLARSSPGSDAEPASELCHLLSISL